MIFDSLSNINILLLLSLSFCDTFLTYHWAMACLKWKPSLKLKQVESNPFIIVCWNNYGLLSGSCVSGGILFGVQMLLSAIHTNVFYIMVVILVFANLNHLRNFWVLEKKLKLTTDSTD